MTKFLGWVVLVDGTSMARGYDGSEGLLTDWMRGNRGFREVGSGPAEGYRVTGAGTDAVGQRQAPSTAVLYYSFILTGLGTALLGPILPSLARGWHLRDEQSGLLLLAQFCGSFAGGITVSGRLRQSLLVGSGAAAVGFAVFSLAPGLAVACAGLLVGGFGLGRGITATNILAGRRFTEKKASKLAMLNFFWSFGAMLAPLLAAWLLPRVPMRDLLVGFAAMLALALAAMTVELRGGMVEDAEASDSSAEVGTGLGRPVFLFFAAMLFVYGGLETSMSGWLTTYALRYGDRTLAVSEYMTLLLWMTLTAGRVGSSLLLRWAGERVVLRVSLAVVAALTAVLGMARGAAGIASCTALLGLALAPFFPVVFAMMMVERPRARQAGAVIAASGLGAAALPWAMGVISTRTGSLQVALAVPFAAALVLLGMSFGRSWLRGVMEQSKTA